MSQQKQPGRNDPCPCGSGKKYKACCMKENLPQGKKKIKASILSKPPGQGIDLMERTFGSTISRKQPYEPPKEPGKEQEHFNL